MLHVAQEGLLVNVSSWSWKVVCAAALVAVFGLAGFGLADEGKGKGPPKGKTIQVDLDSLPPGLAKQVRDAVGGAGKKAAADGPSKGKKPGKGPAAAPSKGKKSEAAPSKGKKPGAGKGAAPSKGKKEAAPSKGKKPAAGPGKHGKGPGKHGKGLALGHQIAPGLRIAPGLHKAGPGKHGKGAPGKHGQGAAAAPGKHGKGPGMHHKGPAKPGKGSGAAPSKGKKPETTARPRDLSSSRDPRNADLEARLDRILYEIEDIRRELRRR
jgi:hypothetical protein